MVVGRQEQLGRLDRDRHVWRDHANVKLHVLVEFVRDVERIVNTIFNKITNSLAEGKRVELRGFGAFSIQHRKSRIGRNPRTGDAVQVEEKFIPRFKTGKELRVKLNSKNNVSEPETNEE